MKIYFFLLFTCSFFVAFAQKDKQQEEKEDNDIYDLIVLDSITVMATREGFQAEDFIDLVRKDTTFYAAFKNLRYHTHILAVDMDIYSKEGTKDAGYAATIRQPVTRKEQLYCRWNKKMSEQSSGRFFDRKGKYNYYTAELFAYLFLTEDTACTAKEKVDQSFDDYSSSMEKHEAQLKTLIFNPGSEVKGVPLIGGKLNIFDPEMQEHYYYYINSEKYKDSTECYVFTVVKKDADSEDVVIDSLSTWFRKGDYKILGRTYTLSYSTLLFDFNVQMDVQLQSLDNELVVKKILYNGWWDLPFKKPEVAEFSVRFYGFE